LGFLLLCSGYSLLRDPHHNKGLAFSERERDAHFLRGLLPPTVASQELQVISSLTSTFSHSNYFLGFFFFFSPFNNKNLMLLPLYSPGEENDAQYPPISSSTAEVYGHDGSSGKHLCNLF
jgi:hypothetical protein